MKHEPLMVLSSPQLLEQPLHLIEKRRDAPDFLRSLLLQQFLILTVQLHLSILHRFQIINDALGLRSRTLEDTLGFHDFLFD